MCKMQEPVVLYQSVLHTEARTCLNGLWKARCWYACILERPATLRWVSPTFTYNHRGVMDLVTGLEGQHFFFFLVSFSIFSHRKSTHSWLSISGLCTLLTAHHPVPPQSPPVGTAGGAHVLPSLSAAVRCCFVPRKLPGAFQGSLELLLTGKGVLAGNKQDFFSPSSQGKTRRFSGLCSLQHSSVLHRCSQSRAQLRTCKRGRAPSPPHPSLPSSCLE